MDYNDYIDNSNDDHSYNVEDDDELYDLVVVGCHITVTYYMKYIDKEHCKDSEQIGYRWLMDCLSSNEAKCHYTF